MEGQGEAAADVLTGALIGRAVEPDGGAHGAAVHAHGNKSCPNCGARLTGAYCANCGQAAHLHRTLSSLGHDILHGVFHFEGKIWRTIPELFLHPGRLTRRYIDGERVKFVSPMALYLFTVFLMFAVFSFTSGAMKVDGDGVNLSPVADWKSNIEAQMEEIDQKNEADRERLNENADLTAKQRAKIESDIAERQSAKDAMAAMISGDWRKMVEFEKQQKAQAAAKPKPNNGVHTDFISPEREAKLNAAIKQATDNPALLFYRLKSSGYKYSWALIPLSVPFMWLLFFWRRDIHLYDHAIFVTYSLSFMMLLLVLLSLGAAAGLTAAIWGTALGIVPALHLYKQLRGAYGVSRFGAAIRLFILSIMIVFVLTLFGLLLLTVGMSG
jgi:hypothetical protein